MILKIRLAKALTNFTNHKKIIEYTLDHKNDLAGLIEETMERWLPGGHLLETWIKNRGLSLERAEKVREDAKKSFEKMFEHDEAIFRGIDQ